MRVRGRILGIPLALLVLANIGIAPAAADVRQIVTATSPNAYCDNTGGDPSYAACNTLPTSLTVTFPRPTVADSKVFVFAQWSTEGTGGSIGSCTDNLGHEWLYDNGQSLIIYAPSSSQSSGGITAVTCQTAFPPPPTYYATSSSGPFGVLTMHGYEVTGALPSDVVGVSSGCSVVPASNMVTILVEDASVDQDESGGATYGDYGVLGAHTSALRTLHYAPPGSDFVRATTLTDIYAALGSQTATAAMTFPNSGYCGIFTVPQDTIPVSETGVNLGQCDQCEKVAGAPINLTNGNVYIAQQDYAIPGLGGGLQLSRTWNSLWRVSPHAGAPTVRMFGDSWTSNFEERLVFVDGQTIDYWRADGSKLRFTLVLSCCGSTIYGIVAPKLDAGLSLNWGTNQYTASITGKSKMTFDSSGRLLSIADWNNNTTTLTYDGSMRLAQVTDAGARSLTFTYGDPNTSTVVTSVQDSVGAVATYQYDPTGLLLQATYADNAFNSFNYDLDAQILSVTDTAGKVIESHTYDGFRRGLSSSRAGGVEVLTVSYDTGVPTLTDSLGHVTTYASTTLNQRNEVTGIAGPGCSSCGGRGNHSFTYDASGNRTSSTDQNNVLTSFTYATSYNATH